MPLRKRTVTAAPAIEFLPYQAAYINDRSPLAVVLKSRQTGLSFADGYAIAEDCLSERRKDDTRPVWPPKHYVLSTTERQSYEYVETVAKHAKALGAGIKLLVSEFLAEGFRFKELSIEFPTGAKLIGLPANPVTARGSAGNIHLDEYDHHHDQDGINKACMPLITRGYWMRVISTPRGKRGLYRLWTHGGPKWSRHRIDIHEAIRQGLKVDLEVLRAACRSAEDWQQEYECAFLDEGYSWIPYELIDQAESMAATEALPDGFLEQPHGPLYFGLDIGRKRHLSVGWLSELVGDVRVTRAVAVAEKMKFRDQKALYWPLIRIAQRACIDNTGIGAQLAEEAADDFGSKVEEVTFTATTKERIAELVRDAYADRRVRIPINPTIREDIHSVQKLVTAAGNTRFNAEETDDGHADRFWGQGLSELAAADGEAYVTPKVDVVENSVARGFGRGMGLGAFATPDEDDEDELRGGFSAGAIL